jgi:hypothetical protein
MQMIEMIMQIFRNIRVLLILLCKDTTFFLNIQAALLFFLKKQKKCRNICVFQKKVVPLQSKLDKKVRMTDQKSHIITLDLLNVGDHVFDFQLDSSYFTSVENSDLLGGNVQVHAELKLRERDFDLTVEAQGVVQVTCDRCLDVMDEEVDVYEDEWDWDEEPKQVDLSWLAYELIVVNLPLVHSHQEGGCNPEMDALLQNHLCTALDEDDDI